MGAKAFGVQSPTQGEDAVSWQTWSDGAGSVPTIDGDADWGKLKLDLNPGEEGRSAVYDLGSAVSRTFTLTENRYGTGEEHATLQIRGSATTFTQDSTAIEWEPYNGAVVKTWRYVQVRASTIDIVVTVLGDSISVQDAVIDRWPDTIAADYNDGRVSLINHAVSGAWITTQAGGSDMDEQTAAAASDAADIIIILLGTNGDSYAVGDEYLENLNELKTSNPNATIYGCGILPRADPTDNGRSIKNPLIAAACSSAGVTYWDTDGWIDPATDTTDGLHPTEAGQAKVAAEILERLP